MIWVSYFTRGDGFRHRLIERDRRKRVRIFVSDFILQELSKTLTDDLHRTSRFALLSCKTVLRIARLIDVPSTVPRYVLADPKDDPIIQSALNAKADFLVTADKEILKLRKIQDLSILSPSQFDEML